MSNKKTKMMPLKTKIANRYSIAIRILWWLPSKKSWKCTTWKWSADSHKTYQQIVGKKSFFFIPVTFLKTTKNTRKITIVILRSDIYEIYPDGW